MHKMNKISHDRELRMRVAWEYFINKRGQAQIAKTYGISRASVSRLLSAATASGLVRISVDVDCGLCLRIEDDMRRVFGIRSVHIIPTADDEESTLDSLGNIVASYLVRNLERYRIISVGWGRTITHIARHVPVDASRSPDGRGEVAEMVGAFEAQGSRLQTMRLAASLAQRIGFSAALLMAPAIANDAAMSAAFRSHDQIQQVLGRAKLADVAIASLGTADENSTLYRLGLISADELGMLQAAGAVAEILGRFVDRNGVPIRTFLDDRLIGLTLEELQAIPEVIVVAAGAGKRQAIHAALRGRLMSHLFTDEQTARWVLQQAEEPGSGAAGP